MNRLLLGILAALSLMTITAADSKVYEMRDYYAPQGKLEDLNARFRNHTLKLFEKHGIENVGYWVPINNTNNKLSYIVAHPSREAAKKAWSAFLADPDWKRAHADSEKNGKLVSKIDVHWFELLDFSPEPKKDSSGNRVFEFRTYTTPPNGAAAINARFRDHTAKLFEKHGMKNIAYFNYMKGEKNADNSLFYILSHKDQDAAKASFDTFRKDPDWIAARKASEEKAGGSLTVAERGVLSEFYKATDYSPIR